MNAELLEGARPVAQATAERMGDKLHAAALQALDTGEAVRVDGRVLVCPDVLVVELIAQGIEPPTTSSIAWPIEGDELDGRRCLILRLA